MALVPRNTAIAVGVRSRVLDRPTRKFGHGLHSMFMSSAMPIGDSPTSSPEDSADMTDPILVQIGPN